MEIRIQDNFLTQHVLELSRGENVLYIVCQNVKTHEQLGNSDHKQIHFDIKIKSEIKNKNAGKTSTKIDIKI